MKKLLFAIAGAAAFAAMANDPAVGDNIDVLGFENFDLTDTANVTGAVVGRTDSGVEGQTKWSCSGDDASLVKTYGGDNVAKGNGLTFPGPFEDEGNQYLALDTNGSELQRAIPAAGQTIAADGTYIDTLVQFTPSESAPTAADLTGAKLAIWLGVDSDNNTTNLCVAGGFYEGAELDEGIPTGAPSVSPKTYKLSGTYDPSTWYRLTVKAIKFVEAGGSVYVGFQISIDGTPLTTDTAAYDSNAMVAFGFLNAETSLLTGNLLVPSAYAALDDNTLTSVGFKGTGALDDFVVTTADPFPASAAIDFTLTWPAGLTAVSYTIDGGEPVAISGASPLAIPSLVGGEAITFIVQNADGAQKTLSATAANGEGIDATGTTFGWADYLGAAVDGAYEIDNLAELKLFQKGVANTNELTTANTTFKLTADIALDEAWPGIGLQNGKDVYNTQQFNDEAFLGTFDGQNHTISGFQMVNGLDYCGFFNSIYGATIQNLKISYAGNLFTAGTVQNSDECGATFVGVAKNSTLFNLTTVAGTVSCSKGFGGIVGYLMAGTTVDSCTNNVNLTSLKPNKAGGIAMITQNGAGKAIIRNCQNNGTIAGSNETGSLIGYVQAPTTTVENCESKVAYKLFHHQSNVVEIQGVTAVASVDPYTGAATPGLNFATVDNGVATFVADDALAASNSYKAMHAATATYEFAAAGSISFDTNLIQAVKFAITAAQGLDAPTETTANGVVTFTVASSATPLNPGQGDGVTYATEEAATTAAGNVTIAATTEVASALGETEAANYVTNFEAKAVSNGAGGYTVQVVLKESVEDALQDQADADAGTVVGALDAASVTVETVPGFYYSIKYGASLEAMSYRTAGELATGASKALTMPAKPGTSGFYKVVIDIAPSAAVAPAQE